MAGQIRFRKSNPHYGWLSNLYPAEITLNGIAYNSCEQLYKRTKCLVTGGSRDQLLEVMQSDSVQCCKLIKKVPSHMEQKWSRIKGNIIIGCMFAKFSQNADLKQSLLDTGERLLLEDTNDPQWGVGKDGKGQNLCGKALMVVREVLRNPNGGPFSKIILGDSILKNIGIPDVANLCFPGSNEHYVETVLPIMAKLPNVTKIVILTGTNSIDNHRDDPHFRANRLGRKLIPMIDKIRQEEPLTQVQLYSCVDRLCDMCYDPVVGEYVLHGPATMLREWNKYLEQYSQRVGQPQQLVFVDVQKLLSDPKYYSTDHLHLNKSGCKLLTQIVQHWVMHMPQTPSVSSPW